MTGTLLQNDEDTFKACLHAITTQCAERGIVAIALNDAEEGYLGIQLQGATQNWNLYINYTESAFKLPHLYLGTPRPPLLAHVGYRGTVCVNDGQGLSLDPDRRADIAAYTVLAGYDILEKSLIDSCTGKTEFYNEIEGYWGGLPHACIGRAAFDIDENDRLITYYLNSKIQPSLWYFTEKGKSAPSEFYTTKLSAQRALYLHLNEIPLPPAPPQTLDASYIDTVQKMLTPNQLTLWASLVGPSKNKPKQLALLISSPRSAGGHSLIGVSFGASSGNINLAADVTPLSIRRHTPTYMRERGGSSLKLINKHIVVIGCGAVGSVIADSLAVAGVGRLTLVDHDRFSEENVFRHVLDPMFIDSFKVLGLQFEFERKYPGIKVKAEPMTAQKWLHMADLSNVDGLVFALGMPSLERSISKALRKTKKPIPILFSWLEALDLGGHSILTWSNNEGCINCLYRDDEGQASLSPRTSFLEPDQHVSRNLTGCSSTFVPYGALQARQTGLIAAEHLLEGLDASTSPSYRYWVGKGAAAIAQGLRTTAWWHTAKTTSNDEATLKVFGQPCQLCKKST